jgi:hypothetical protein
MPLGAAVDPDLFVLGPVAPNAVSAACAGRFKREIGLLARRYILRVAMNRSYVQHGPLVT